MHRKALGRGLDALIPVSSPTATEELAPGARELPISEIGSNPFQPRSRFEDDAIRELAASIKATGVLQPVLVRGLGRDGYQLVAGERRLRAASLAGLETIPAVVREVDDREMLELALVENVQREDLNPIEEAKAYNTLATKLGMTHDQISERVGKQRVSITNALRLLVLPPEVQDMVSRGTLTAGHARALLSLESGGDQLAASRYVQSKGFSVRRTESYVRRKLRRHHSRPPGARLAGLMEWENKLQQKFSTHVSISPKRKGGKVEFEYYGQEDLERLLEAWGVL
ncbi:MAG: ParB/RepB/Spo0J family partition protein [Candidatus Eisenbacteria bacterium]|uniref:ParB/RepB/Spo0J family partition protein n=1 Tax=Eiseniibacteriota bacterium TaxID=2212470 RepID=A0A538SS20_UNCEI|nr:MAG: ParB/RepB/Spo0J family partition protein [Candidatus Eisenbacteria bacterium]